MERGRRGREGREGEEEEKKKSKERKRRGKKKKTKGGSTTRKQVKGTHKIFFFFAEATEKIFARLPLDLFAWVVL